MTCCLRLPVFAASICNDRCTQPATVQAGIDTVASGCARISDLQCVWPQAICSQSACTCSCRQHHPAGSCVHMQLIRWSCLISSRSGSNVCCLRFCMVFGVRRRSQKCGAMGILWLGAVDWSVHRSATVMVSAVVRFCSCPFSCCPDTHISNGGCGMCSWSGSVTLQTCKRSIYTLWRRCRSNTTEIWRGCSARLRTRLGRTS